MTRFPRSIVVIGAGVLGLTTALALCRRGAAVTVIDPDRGRGSASAAAAGMIAPALEAALEAATPARAALYRQAAALWPDLARGLGVDLVVDGADWLGAAEPMAGRLRALGFAFEHVGPGLHIPGEARLNPQAALTALAGAVETAGGKVEGGRAERVAPAAGGGFVVTADGRRFEAEAVVLAAGWQAGAVRAEGLEALCRRVTPVKGQIISLDGPGAAVVQRITRTVDVYLLPSDIGVIAGATMQPGASDCDVDEAAVERLRRAAVAAVPALAQTRVRASWAGVRGATPDGLPMAGATAVPGLFAALAPRRNGWLLAPLAADAAAAAVMGEPQPRGADALRPDRFDPA